MSARQATSGAASACPRCQRAKREWADVCWHCHVEDLEKAAEQRGYARGLEEGRQQLRAPIQTLDVPRIRQLLQLCHPDRHGGSVAANEATRWLLEQRKRLEGAR